MSLLLVYLEGDKMEMQVFGGEQLLVYWSLNQKLACAFKILGCYLADQLNI